VGADAGSKLKRAQTAGTPLLDEAAFLGLLRGDSITDGERSTA